VGGLPYGGCGRDTDALGVQGPGPAAVPFQDVARSGGPPRVAAAGAVPPPPDPGDDHVPRELLEALVLERPGRGHQQPDRVGAEVQDAHPAGLLVRMNRPRSPRNPTPTR